VTYTSFISVTTSTVYDEVLQQIIHDWIQVQKKNLCNVYYKPMPRLMTIVFWDVMPQSLVDMYHCFRGIFCLHYQGRPWECRQVFLKHPIESPCLHGIIFQTTVIFIIPAMTTSNLNFHPYLSFCYSLIFSKKFYSHTSFFKKGLMSCSTANCQKRPASNKSLKL
jgi:hypothetical protein